MGDIASFWSYEENNEMEQKLLFTTLELEKQKAEAIDEMIKNKEYVKQLIDLLKVAIQERNEARDQLQKLIHLINPVKPNSTITETNSFGSSPVESFFNPVPSPDLFVTNQPLPQLYEGSLIIENVAEGKVLPQKGKFLKAVIEAGPLLQTLLVAGPLPRWRNPPQPKLFQMPPVPIKGVGEVNDVPNVGYLNPRLLNAQPYYGQMSCGPTQAQTSPMINFGNVGSRNCLNDGGSMVSSGINIHGYVPMAKRQRFC